MLRWLLDARGREARRLNRDAAAVVDLVRHGSPAGRAAEVARRLRRDLDEAHARGGADPARYGPLVAHFRTQHREARNRRDDAGLSTLTLVIIYLRAEALGEAARPACDAIDAFLAGPVSE